MLIAGLKHDANPSWGKICLHFHLVSISFKRPLHSDFVPVSVSFEQPFSVVNRLVYNEDKAECLRQHPTCPIGDGFERSIPHEVAIAHPSATVSHSDPMPLILSSSREIFFAGQLPQKQLGAK